MHEGCLHMCCTACPCDTALHYASNTIFMYEESCAGHRMYVGSAKPFQRMRGNLIFEFANWPHCNCCPHKTPCNQRDIVHYRTPPPAITEQSQSFHKCTHIVCPVTSNISGEFSGGVTWTPWAGRQVGTRSRPACCKPYHMALWTCHVLESF